MGIIFPALVFILSGWSVLGQHMPESDHRTGEEFQVFQDICFRGGLGIGGLAVAAPQNRDTIIPFGTGSGRPVWRIAQWGSKFDLSGIRPQHSGDTVLYANLGKKIAFIQEPGGIISVSLCVYASREYSAPRKAGESWPHLLLEQPVYMPVNVKELRSMPFQMYARLLFADMKMTDQQFDPSLHTCQVTLYLTVHNNNRQSGCYGDFFWFGLPLYDFRYRNIGEYAARDGGNVDATDKFILTVAGEKLYEGSLHDRQWVFLSGDIRPFIVYAFRKAQDNGYMAGTRFEDLSIGSMNIGWEVPGTFDCGIQLKGLSLKGVLP